MTGRPMAPHIPLDMQPYLRGRRLEFESVAQMLTVRAQETPEAPHVYYYDQALTYKDTNDRANKIANFLKAKGVQKGDVVAVMILNAPEIYYAMWGAQKLGAVALVVNFMLKGPEIAYVLDDAKPKIAFVGSDYMEEFAAGWNAAQAKPYVVEAVTEAAHDSALFPERVGSILDEFPADECLVEQALDDPFLLLYSSGTTGKPKGILLSNRAELSICRDVNKSGIISGDDVMLLMLPMFHVNPLCVFTYPLSYAGQALCIRSRFSVSEFWPAVIRYGVTIVMGVPTMFDYILNKNDAQDVDLAKVKIRYVNTGGAALSDETRRQFKEKFNLDFRVGYGLTENCGAVSVESPLMPIKEGSCGMPYPEQQVEIMDDQDNILPVNVVGEICIKGDCVFSGYLNKGDKFAETMRGGFLHTGDVGYFDEQGYLYVTARKVDLIIRGGENIYPREIEIALEANPSVAEAAVIGVPDAVLGQRVKAFITLKAEGTLTADATRAWLTKRLAGYKIPEFYEFVAELPRTPTGKIKKCELRNRI